MSMHVCVHVCVCACVRAPRIVPFTLPCAHSRSELISFALVSLDGSYSSLPLPLGACDGERASIYYVR